MIKTKKLSFFESTFSLIGILSKTDPIFFACRFMQLLRMSLRPVRAHRTRTSRVQHLWPLPGETLLRNTLPTTRLATTQTTMPTQTFAHFRLRSGHRPGQQSWSCALPEFVSQCCPLAVLEFTTIVARQTEQCLLANIVSGFCFDQPFYSITHPHHHRPLLLVPVFVIPS